MASVKVIRNDIETALKRFRKAVQEDKVIETWKSKQFYEKPSQARRNKRKRYGQTS